MNTLSTLLDLETKSLESEGRLQTLQPRGETPAVHAAGAKHARQEAGGRREQLPHAGQTVRDDAEGADLVTELHQRQVQPLRSKK